MVELTLGLSDYFAFYNSERPHQALGYKTPNEAYLSGIGGGAMIMDKFGGALVEPASAPPAGGAEAGSTNANTSSETPVDAGEKIKPGQRRAAANEVECTA